MLKEVTSMELRGLIPRVKIIDIRDNYQFKLGSIPTATNIPMNFLITNPDTYLDKEEAYYIVCEYGNRSKNCCYELLKKGYQVINIIGGYNQYKLK